MNTKAIPIEDRLRVFKQEIADHVQGNYTDFPLDEIKDFIKYWSETGNSAWSREMRYEAREFWNTANQLDRHMERAFQRNPEKFRNKKEVYRIPGPVKTAEQLEKERKEIIEMQEIYEALKEKAKKERHGTPLAGLAKRRWGYNDPKYQQAKERYLKDRDNG